MDVAIHLGAHCTDASRLRKTLMRNRAELSGLGVVVPDAKDYRDVLRTVMNRLRGDPGDDATRDVLLEAMGADETTERLVLSNANFISMVSMAVEYGQIYPKIAKAAWLRNLFPDSPVAFFISVRNPATFLPAVFEEAGRPEAEFPAFLTRAEPQILRWSDTIAALREACPDCPVTVWCHEDTPLFWPEIIHRVAGVRGEMPLKGMFDMLRPVMTGEGMNRLRVYTRAHPPATEKARRQVMTAFLDKFAHPDAIEEERSLPGWSADLVQRLSTLYEADLGAIAALPGVTLLPD
ncbi:PD-(D/E)XK nuclease family protein [Oceaniglobus indicus]|uniref:PD-(D/E)XK nuclease family protein n=1 Tax=Oceaniglobus indicus TaxID=2047749 RepID=UPI0011AB5CCE|nr:PD-(D/E)XK nuclease family protein [Oceaniglobus indicus]